MARNNDDLFRYIIGNKETGEFSAERIITAMVNVKYSVEFEEGDQSAVMPLQIMTTAIQLCLFIHLMRSADHVDDLEVTILDVNQAAITSNKVNKLTLKNLASYVTNPAALGEDDNDEENDEETDLATLTKHLPPV